MQTFYCQHQKVSGVSTAQNCWPPLMVLIWWMSFSELLCLFPLRGWSQRQENWEKCGTKFALTRLETVSQRSRVWRSTTWAFLCPLLLIWVYCHHAEVLCSCTLREWTSRHSYRTSLTSESQTSNHQRVMDGKRHLVPDAWTGTIIVTDNRVSHSEVSDEAGFQYLLQGCLSSYKRIFHINPWQCDPPRTMRFVPVHDCVRQLKPD